MKPLRSLVLTFFVAIAAVTILNAQGAAGQSAPATSPAPANSVAASAASAQPGAAPTTILEYAPPPAEYARAKAYSHAHYRHVFINTFYGLLLLLVVLRWRIAPAFRDLAERVSARRFVQKIVFVPLILLTIAVLGIPPDIWITPSLAPLAFPCRLGGPGSATGFSIRS